MMTLSEIRDCVNTFLFQDAFDDREIRFEYPKHQKKKSYPKGRNREAVYITMPCLDKEGERVGTKHVYSCPVCMKPVTRRQEYCSECGNKLKKE